MIPETISSASADEEKNGRSVEFIWKPLAGGSLITVLLLVRFCDHVTAHKKRKPGRRMAGFFIGKNGAL